MAQKPTYAELEEKLQQFERSELDCRLAVEALRESEELHRITLSNISDAVFITDDAGVFVYICPNVEVIFGYSYVEVNDLKTIEKLFGANIFDRAELDAYGEIRNLERIIQDKSGASHVLLVNIKPISIKGGTVLYTCRDITDRKRAHDELLESEERYRQLFDNESDAVMVFDAQSNQLEDANPATLELFGYSKEEFVRLRIEDISAEQSRIKAAVEKIMTGNLESRYVPLRYFKKKDGVVFPVELYAGAFISKGRQKIIGAVRDITERMRAEEAVRKLSLNLLAAQEMERKRIALELHDDLGQTLALLKLRIINIQSKLPATQDKLKSECQETLKITTETIEKMRKISHGLSPGSLDVLGLTVSLQSLGKDFFNYLDTNVQQDIENIDMLFSPIAKITIYRIFQEIFTNVEKHAKADHVKIEVKKQQDNVTFMIEDDGKGFDLDRIEFAHRNETGLGLGSMAERVRMLGGRFVIESCPNVGTKIYFSIPF